MICNISRSSILSILFAGVVSLGVVFPLKAVYAHTFSGGESAAFLALVKILLADSQLVQSNIASNVTSAQAHANAVAEHLDANTTKELVERNKLVANDLTKAISDLNQTVQSKPAPTADVVKGKIKNIDALLEEAITVRVEKNQLSNSTVKGQAISDIIDETLERYREAYGIEEGKSTAGHNNIVNTADYQSAQAIAAKAQEMFNEAKQLIPANELSSTSSAITKVGNDLSTLKNDIDTKVPYDRVATFANSTITPDLKAAFKLEPSG
ncbi:MAG: hypothetical protein ACJ71R_03225 [Nitrososphaeraceae archaeon]